MRTYSRGRRRGINTVYSPSRSLLLPAPPLLAPRCAAKLSRLRRESSLRRPAPSSLVVQGGGREERRAMKEKNGARESTFPSTVISLHLVFACLLSHESLTLSNKLVNLYETVFRTAQQERSTFQQTRHQRQSRRAREIKSGISKFTVVLGVK